MNFPAITVCREIPYNPDEYVRVIFDNFQMACDESSVGCEETQMLRDDFWEYLFLNDVILLTSVTFKNIITLENFCRLLAEINGVYGVKIQECYYS